MNLGDGASEETPKGGVYLFCCWVHIITSLSLKSMTPSLKVCTSGARVYIPRLVGERCQIWSSWDKRVSAVIESIRFCGFTDWCSEYNIITGKTLPWQSDYYKCALPRDVWYLRSDLDADVRAGWCAVEISHVITPQSWSTGHFAASSNDTSNICSWTFTDIRTLKWTRKLVSSLGGRAWRAEWD